MTEVAIPDVVDDVVDELSSGSFCHFVGHIVSREDGMLGIHAGLYCCRGIVSNDRVCWGVWWNGKGSPPCCCVGGSRCNDSDQVVCPVLIVWYV